ncbi:MAG: amidohydrolase family protein [Gemmatimonadales bacterium]
MIRPALIALALVLPPTLGAQRYAFVNVNVIPMDRETVLRDQTVVVENGMITAVGPSASTTVPSGATRIEARGRYLMPGLAEMHAHVPGGQAQQYTENVLFLYVASGITTVRGMLGAPAHLTMREQLLNNQLMGPRLWTSGPSVNGNSVPTADSAARTPAFQQSQGYDLIKIHPGLSLEAFNALDAAADQINMPFAGHVPAAVGVRRAIAAGYASIDHLDGYVEAAAGATSGGWFGVGVAPQVNPATLQELVRLTAVAGVWNVPTQTLMETYASDATADEWAARHPEIRYVPAQQRQQWLNTKTTWRNADIPMAQRAHWMQVRRQLIRDLYRETGRVLLGSDAPQIFNVPGFSTLWELETYIEAGLTPYEALTTGTTAVARYFGVSDRAGTVQAGRWADLILLEANPLERISNVRQQAGVMVRGRWMPKSEIDARLAQIAAEYAN